MNKYGTYADRTSELRRYGYQGRRLGPKQMTTDTAVRVTRMIVEDKRKHSRSLNGLKRATNVLQYIIYYIYIRTTFLGFTANNFPLLLSGS